MEPENLQIGDLVTSLMGRDKQDLYIVAGIANGNYVNLVNGNSKKFKNPKFKNAKHLKKLESYEHIKEKLDSKTLVYDSEIYSLIKKYKA